MEAFGGGVYAYLENRNSVVREGWKSRRVLIVGAAMGSVLAFQ